eukprot:NODE_143_length_15882_cov_1.296585.p11 type:complete len:138 gc:universal NODE_143_length_15882_cov_1.296585:600-1013(+)
MVDLMVCHFVDYHLGYILVVHILVADILDGSLDEMSHSVDILVVYNHIDNLADIHHTGYFENDLDGIHFQMIVDWINQVEMVEMIHFDIQWYLVVEIHHMEYSVVGIHLNCHLVVGIHHMEYLVGMLQMYHLVVGYH